MISYETSHPVIFRADQPYESLVMRVPRHLLGRQEAQISSLTAVGIPGSEGLAEGGGRRSSAGWSAGWRTGRSRAEDAPNTVECVLDLVRALYAGPVRRDGADAAALAGGDPAQRPVVHRGEPRRSGARSGARSPARASSRPGTCTSSSRPRARASAAGSASRGWSAAAATCSTRRCGDETILAIASRWGLPGPQHFSRLFRSAYGCSPSELRREAKASRRRRRRLTTPARAGR